MAMTQASIHKQTRKEKVATTVLKEFGNYGTFSSQLQWHCYKFATAQIYDHNGFVFVEAEAHKYYFIQSHPKKIKKQ